MSSPHIFSSGNKIGLDLPRLPLRPVAVAGRIEDHRVVLVAALELAAAKLHRVLGDPPHRPIRQAGEHRVLPRRSTIVCAASMCTTSAPAADAASVLPPVYANKFKTRGARPSAACGLANRSRIHRQFAACSGNTPTCPEGSASSFNRNATAPSASDMFQTPFRRHPQIRHRCPRTVSRPRPAKSRGDRLP